MHNRIRLPIDIALIGVGTVLAFMIREAAIVDIVERPGLGLYLVLSLVFGAISHIVLGVGSRVWRYFSFVDVLWIVAVTGLTVLLAWSVTFLINRADLIPRSVPPIQLVNVAVLLVLARSVKRLLTPRILVRSQSTVRKAPRRTVLLVGMNDVAELYLRSVEKLSAGTVEVAGILDEDPSHQRSVLRGARVIGTPANIRDVVNAQAVHGVYVDTIVITERFGDLSEGARGALRYYEKTTGQSLDLFEERLGLTPRESDAPGVLQEANSVYESSRTAPKRIFYRFVKRGIDLIVAAILVVILAPLIVMVSLLTLFDVGMPLHFWQVRPGLRGRQFRVLKFRTMRGAHDATGRRIPDSLRSSAIGRVLRKTRLDELPQLINILKGDMSFIGPRPLLPVDQPQQTTIRLSVRPGLSGWAQVNGGKLLSIDDKAALDAWYVENMSLGLDIEIGLKTLLLLMNGERPVQAEILSEARKCVRGYQLAER